MSADKRNARDRAARAATPEDVAVQLADKRNARLRAKRDAVQGPLNADVPAHVADVRTVL
jgi:hypothetical protein